LWGGCDRSLDDARSQMSIWVTVSDVVPHYASPRTVSLRKRSNLRSSRAGSGQCLRAEGGWILTP